MACVELIRRRISLLIMTGVCALGCAIGACAMAGVFRTTGYESNLTATAFLVSREGLVALLTANAQMNPHLETYAELTRAARRYLVVQISNAGNQRAWGSVACSFSGREVVINVPDLPPRMNLPNLYVSEISGFVLPPSNSVPSVAVLWETLNAK